jgi:predicted XRE-type DNA-binding protein
LIRHLKVEAELLALLQWSHEESLRTSEEFQRTIRTYEHLLNLYQRRIAELLNIQGSENEINWLMERAIELEREIAALLVGQNIDTPVQESPFDWLLDRAIQLEREIQLLLREHDTQGVGW